MMVLGLRVSGVFRVEGFGPVALLPDPREDLENRSPNLGPYTSEGTL